jgi:hypothetical protein
MRVPQQRLRTVSILAKLVHQAGVGCTVYSTLVMGSCTRDPEAARAF